jgi:hypothetical protein
MNNNNNTAFYSAALNDSSTSDRHEESDSELEFINSSHIASGSGSGGLGVFQPQRCSTPLPRPMTTQQQNYALMMSPQQYQTMPNERMCSSVSMGSGDFSSNSRSVARSMMSSSTGGSAAGLRCLPGGGSSPVYNSKMTSYGTVPDFGVGSSGSLGSLASSGGMGGRNASSPFRALGGGGVGDGVIFQQQQV